MELKIEYKTKKEAYRYLIEILSVGSPFDVLNDLEKDVLSWMYATDGIMDHDAVAADLNTSKNSVFVKKNGLKKKGFIHDDSALPKYKIAIPERLSFRFVDISGKGEV